MYLLEYIMSNDILDTGEEVQCYYEVHRMTIRRWASVVHLFNQTITRPRLVTGTFEAQYAFTEDGSTGFDVCGEVYKGADRWAC